MSRKHHELEGGARGSSDKAVWDTGSSLYDSYELAAVRRLLDRRLLAATAAGVPALLDEPEPPPPAAGETTRGKSTQAVPVGRVQRHRKVTPRALFRAVANWAARPTTRHAPPLACACAGIVHDQSGAGAGAAVEPDLPSHGQLRSFLC